MQETLEITIEGERFRLQRVYGEIKAIGDRATLLLGYLVIIIAALTSFVFTDFSSQANQLRLLAIALLGIYSANASIVFGVLIASFEVISEDKPETLKILQGKITANLQKLATLKYWYRFSIVFSFATLISICIFATYSAL